MKASIIILSYGNAHITLRCLEQLLPTLDDKYHEVILFDNGSPADQLRILKKSNLTRGITLKLSPDNLGFASGCNRAAEVANGESLLFLNNDILVTTNWLQPLLTALDEPSCGIAGPLLTYPDGKIQCGGIGFGLWGLPVNIANGVETEQFTHTPEHLFGISGACLAIRRDLFSELNGFDERFFFSYEDIDLCMRALKNGYSSLLCSDSVLLHHESKSHAGEQTVQLRWQAEEKFIEKWDDCMWPLISARLASLHRSGIDSALVYGTGRAGLQMLKNLQRFDHITVTGFLDDIHSTTAKSFQGYKRFGLNSIPDTNAILVASMYLHAIKHKLKKRTDIPVVDTLLEAGSFAHN